jgi:L-ascorbate metabolism protein UlaG (beta-lactamase superfamily)
MIHTHFKCWFSGDLGYSADTVDIGKKMKGFDLAAIAIGAYEPRWFMKNSHINPNEAIQVMKDVKAKAALAIHWGTFENLSDEPLDAPPIDLKKARDLEPTSLDFRVLKHGQTWVLPLCKKVT